VRIDVVSIFPDYLDALRLSLVGKAIRTGLVELEVHDLRQWTHDRHRTVDDTPYGGGAGMVMSPGPWGEALDALATEDSVLVVPTPSGEPFTQRLASELATCAQLLFACGRYEGIDARVTDHARDRMRVVEVSLGDYVLNGGEVAALAVIEAVVRLIPGVVGNPASLTEESHSADTDSLLEYPVFTKPAVWRGLSVPPVLLSGDHGRIARWRRAESVRRTTERRPELVRDADVGVTIGPAAVADAGELLTVQKGAFSVEADRLGTTVIPPLRETLAELTAVIEASLAGTGEFWVARVERPAGPGRLVGPGRIVGSVRGSVAADDPTAWYVGRLMVAPDLHGRGIGAALMDVVERGTPPGCTRITLVTAEASRINRRFYAGRGYRRSGRFTDSAGIPVLVLERPIEAKEPVPDRGL